MSIATIIPQVHAFSTSAGIIKNILAGFAPRLSGFDLVRALSKDIGGFEFDYIGEERIQAGTDITDHYSEDNIFMQDHIAVKPTIIVMRGFVAEKNFNRNELLKTILSLQSALTIVKPYVGKYAPGATQKMEHALGQTEQIIDQLGAIASTGASIAKLVGFLSKTEVQKAYDKLDGLRTSGYPFAVVTPWATFGDIPGSDHGPMMIENLIMTVPDETRGWADIVVTLKEIRVAPSLISASQDNARGSQAATTSGTAGAR